MADGQVPVKAPSHSAAVGRHSWAASRLPRVDWRRDAPLIALVMAIAAEIILFGAVNSRFLTGTNAGIVLRQISLEAIVAVSSTAIMVAASIDLSFASVVGLAGSITGVMLGVLKTPIWVGILAGLAGGALVGLLNGLSTEYMRIPAFITTLATMFIAKGLSLQITGGYPIPISQHSFWVLGQGFLGPVALPVVYMFAALILGHLWLTRTVSGQHVFAVGSNESAARRAGLGVHRLRVSLFVFQGLTSAMAGILLASRLASATPTVADDWLLDVVAAVIVGGTSLFGGRGSLVGTFLGLLFMGILANGMIMMNTSPNIQLVVKGLFILAAVGFQVKTESTPVRAPAPTTSDD
jgi:ribose transport system permease protein